MRGRGRRRSWQGSKPVPNASESVDVVILGINEENSAFSTALGTGYGIETIESRQLSEYHT